DERAVGADHTDSNFRMAKETLLSRVPLSPERIHRMEGEAEDLDEAARRYGEKMSEVLERDDRGVPILDFVLLGLGDDGHTASLFPGTAALGEMSAAVVANEVPQLRTRRMTMTFPVFNAARSVLFLVTGEKKAPIVGEILNASPGENAYPAARVLPGGNSLLWMLDAAAAKAVTNEKR
ncbi:6-phosphogluconolactonase, partial [Candidatus Sumerlaeota bacterium]|nr:6-phosphogluconolactonase [Candidatus Sumerlaeota bacterium]